MAADGASLARRADEAFEAESRVLTLERTRVSCLLGITLVPAFAGLDHLVHPGEAGTFLEWRLGCAGVLALVAFATYLPEARRFPAAWGYVAYLAVALAITAMTYRLGGPDSPYYAGLCLVLLTMVLVMPWRTRHTAAVSGVIYLAFLLPGVFDQVQRPLAAQINNQFFLLATVLIACCGTLLSYRARRRRFDLSWRLAARSQELSAANEQLRELDATKARFFANVSHELRTPLTLMLAPLEAALEQPLPDHLRRELETLQVNARRLALLIDDLLDVARRDAGRDLLRAVPVRLDLLAEGVVAAARPYAQRCGIALTLSAPSGLPPVLCDRGRVEQALFNLVSNALKFTPSDGRVEVTVAEDGPDRLALSVADDGPGIPMERMATLFERFAYSVDSRHSRGSGLGLALVKEQVEAHGGTVELDSSPDRGTTFVVRLPLGAPREELLAASRAEVGADEDAAARRAAAFAAVLAGRTHTAGTLPVPAPEVEPGDRPLVLVVDDDRELRDLIRSVLEGEHRVVEAVDGVQGLEAFVRHRPDLVLSDIEMPGMDGIQLCRRLRALPGGEHVPFLFVTARAGHDPRLHGLETGANDYLTKPFSRRELQARVRNFLLLRHYEQELEARNADLQEALRREQEAREQAVRAEKLAALGRMTVEVGHEVNNAVNPLLNFARRLLRDSRGALDAWPEAAPEGPADPAGVRRALARFPDALARVVYGGERIATIVQGLRQLTGATGPGLARLDVDAEVDAALRLASAGVPAGVRILRRGGGAGVVLSPSTGLGQVVANLVSNSLKAVGDEGTVEVETGTCDGQAVLTVRDDGCGMEPDVLSRVYDPFFTTRLGGEGMGVGMALVHRIVTQDAGGRIDCRSAPGQGTTWRVLLPLAAAESRVRTPAAA